MSLLGYVYKSYKITGSLLALLLICLSVVVFFVTHDFLTNINSAFVLQYD